MFDKTKTIEKEAGYGPFLQKNKVDLHALGGGEDPWGLVTPKNTLGRERVGSMRILARALESTAY